MISDDAMTPKVRGSKSVREWLGLLKDSTSSFYRKLDEIYGDEEALTKGPAQVCLRALEAFGESFGWDRDVIVVRSTGRINLMGMHIDHRGGSVNPIAIKEVFFIAEAREDDVVLVRNVQSDEFPEEKFRIRDCLPQYKIENWDAWCHDEFEKRKHDPSITWSNYVRAAVLYLQHLNTRDDGSFKPILRGMNVMVYGKIPRAAGLSSSSSIVVAAADACIRINDLKVSPMDFIDICGWGEWYVGTRGGSGDHAAIKFGKPEFILHMTAFPLTVEYVPFPKGCKIVLANSMIEAKKQAGARDTFNSRIASYQFGLMLVRKQFPQFMHKLTHLRNINPKTLGVDGIEIYRIIKSMPESIMRQDILKLLADQEDEVRHIFRSHTQPADGYKIRQVCLYGITECIRADMAAERLKKGDIRSFGELVNISHDGDRVTKLLNGKRIPIDNNYPDEKINTLINDLRSSDPVHIERARLWRQPGGYNVSVPEIDMLVDIALSTSGVFGAGLVGAGLGGSIIAVIEENSVQKLLHNLTQEYYRPLGLPVRTEIVAPVGGAGVLDV